MKRVPIVILITAVVTALCLFFLDTCNPNPKKIKPDKTQLIEAEKKVSSVDKHYTSAFALLKKQSDSIENELYNTQYKLKIAKMKLNQSQFKVMALANKSDDTLSTKERLTDCDSLKAATLNYVARVDSVNCLYEKNISELNDLVATKDSQIVICRSSYDAMKNLTEENLKRERTLTDELNTAYKVQKRKRLQNKILGAGLLILSGITSTFLINSTK